MKNLFRDIPTDLPEEVAEVLVETSGHRIERIVSQGHVSPEGIWYNRVQYEWCSRLIHGVEAILHDTFLGIDKMPEGTIKRLTDRGFGFIDTGSNDDMFFHSADLEGVSYEELQEGQRVSYTAGQGPKGPRAENVKPV